MCGEYSGCIFKKDHTMISKYAPVWRITKDEQYISFYANPRDCDNSTSWCRAHCYHKLKPVEILDEMAPIYKIDDFLNPIRGELGKDFAEAKYVTMFAGGTLSRAFVDHTRESVIHYIPTEHPDKLFRFFIRGQIPDNRFHWDHCTTDPAAYSISMDSWPPKTPGKHFKVPKNARIIFSADTDTSPELLNWACLNKHIGSIAVVNHRDNRHLISVLKLQLPVIDCMECNNTNQCFHSTEKSLLLLDWIGEEE